MSVMDMQDRELLYLAAKAASLKLCWVALAPYPGAREYPQVGAKGWNPLADDGDALRLAFHLGMSVDMGCCRITYDEDDKELEFELIGGDIGWVRRAITRAAAEIGRSMPC